MGYAPHYNPFFGTYSMTDIAGIQQVQPVVDEPEQDLVGPDDFEEDNINIISEDDLESDFAPTIAPTESSNPHLRGPKDQPKPDPEVSPTSSSRTRISGTTTMLLLIPAAFSMILL